MSLGKFMSVALLALAYIPHADSAKGVEVPATDPVRGTDKVVGCFASLGGMELKDDNGGQSQGRCAGICREMNSLMGATYQNKCYCGDKMPNKATLLPDSRCNEPCPGFDPEACGGLGAYTVYNIGFQIHVPEAELEVTSTTSVTSSTSTSTTQTSATHSATDPAQSDPPKKGKDQAKPNIGGIVAGVVVGVIAALAIVGGAFFYVRRKRNSQLEEEHRRNAAVNAFITGGKPPRSSGGMSIADSRMDPIMNRRMSDGSIADNQDYSRRILRVTNV